MFELLKNSVVNHSTGYNGGGYPLLVICLTSVENISEIVKYSTIKTADKNSSWSF